MMIHQNKKSLVTSGYSSLTDTNANALQLKPAGEAFKIDLHKIHIQFCVALALLVWMLLIIIVKPLIGSNPLFGKIDTPPRD